MRLLIGPFSVLVRRPLADRALALLAAVGTLASSAHGAPVVYNIGIFPGWSNSSAYGITPDGWTVTGTCDSTTPYVFAQAVRWTLQGGLQNLGTLGSLNWTTGNRLSSNGQAITGNANNALYRWTQSGGLQNLGLGPGSNLAVSQGITGDGNTVVGWSFPGNSNGAWALRWTQSGGVQTLPNLSGGGSATAYGVSPDGSTIVGAAGTNTNTSIAVRWMSAGTVILPMGTLPGGVHSAAYDVSANNATIVGSSMWSGTGWRAFRWTQQTGMVNLGMPSGGFDSAVLYSVNGDGKAAVGRYNVGTNVWRAMFWNTTVGTVDLTNYLNSIGANLSGYTLVDSGDISADGSALVATGELNGVQRGFLIRNIPCPSTATIIRDPVDRVVCPGSTVNAVIDFEAEAPGGGQDGLEYQWMIESPPDSGAMFPLHDGPFADPVTGITFDVTGATGPALGISDMRALPGGIRWVTVGGVVTNPCGTTNTALARVSIAAPCNPADITSIGGTGEPGECADGQLTLDDILTFVNAYVDEVGCPTPVPGEGACNIADITDIGDSGAGPDGVLTLDDILAFVNAYNDGCP